MRILAVIILALTLLALVACTTDNEREYVDMDYRDPAIWARDWLITNTERAKSASESAQWSNVTNLWEFIGPCVPDNYLGLPAKRDREAFRKACTELASVFDGHDTHGGVGGRFKPMTEAEQSNADSILAQLACDMGYPDC